MYGSRIDPDQGLLIGLFSGANNDDDDYQRYVDSILEGDRRTRAGTAQIAILMVDRGNPPPSAKWRKRIADTTAKLRTEGAVFVLCAESPLIRGVLTAINWIRPPPYAVRIVATFDEVLAVVAERRAPARAVAIRMLAELRAEAQRG